MKNIINVDFQNTINSGMYCVANNTNDLFLILTPTLIQKTKYRVEVTDVNKTVHTSSILELNANDQIEYQVDSSYFNGAGVMKIRLLSNESNSYYIVFNCIKFTNEDLSLKYANGEYNFSIKGSSSGMLIDMIYPIGAQIYNASKDFDPNEYYPGTTWTRIKGYVLAGINENDQVVDGLTFNKASGEKIGVKYQDLRAWIGATHGDINRLGYYAQDKVNGQFATYSILGSSTISNVGYDNIAHTTMVSNTAGQQHVGVIQPTQMTYIWERIS